LQTMGRSLSGPCRVQFAASGHALADLLPACFFVLTEPCEQQSHPPLTAWLTLPVVPAELENHASIQWALAHWCLDALTLGEASRPFIPRQCGYTALPEGFR
jgi:hypothetical protein